MLPSQKYPVHTHHHKEETFRVLSGDLTVKIESGVFKLYPGDAILVDRYREHEFYTLHGVIFEEISTTHILGDSYYKDTSIYSLDPMERKTAIEKI
jgi:N-acetylneuraminate synthase